MADTNPFLLSKQSDLGANSSHRKRKSFLFCLFLGVFLVLLAVGCIVINNYYRYNEVEEGFPWTENMLSWQRTAFHFQPEHNWMSDPSGPVYYKGWYHFFYQYNPNGPLWGHISWGHAVSKDMVHWFHLPLAMVPDHWFDIGGCFTGSITVLPNGKIIMLYTGGTAERPPQQVQMQNLAYPEDENDPLLLKWKKYSGNPILLRPPGIGKMDFRDPTVVWNTSEGKWRFLIGSKWGKTGIIFIYDTQDFINYELLPWYLHSVSGTGVWECVDLYPVSTTDEHGLDVSINGPNMKHVLKASVEDVAHDYYAFGTYDDKKAIWTPDDPEMDVGLGNQYDYGAFYASRSFYDPEKKRRLVWGFVRESDSEATDVKKGWSTVQAMPRTILLDKKTKNYLLLWPVEEVESLRLRGQEFNNVEIKADSVVPLDLEGATQLDIVAEFELDKNTLESTAETDLNDISCGMNGGAAQRGALGPFGFMVLADINLTERTSVYFYVAKGHNGTLKTLFCTDQTWSSLANDVNKRIYGGYVPVLDGEKFTMRILVDHSIVEGYAQGGRACITSRVYPTRAIYGDAMVYLFNNALEANITASVKIWQMNSAFIKPYSSEYSD